MAYGRNKLSHGGGCPGRGGGERQNLRDQPNRRSRSYRYPPERFSPGPMDRPPPPHRPTHARGSRPPQLGERAGGGAFSTSAAPPKQPPPETGNGGLIQVRGGWSRVLREFWISLSFDRSCTFISFSYSLGD